MSQETFSESSNNWRSPVPTERHSKPTWWCQLSRRFPRTCHFAASSQCSPERQKEPVSGFTYYYLLMYQRMLCLSQMTTEEQCFLWRDLCSLMKRYEHFGGISCFQLQCRRINVEDMVRIIEMSEPQDNSENKRTGFKRVKCHIFFFLPLFQFYFYH